MASIRKLAQRATGPVPSPMHATEQAEAALELSFVEEAEMVFTTLSSSGRRIFQRLSQPFHTVLIDEAAQASEVAALQPLAFGCQRCAGV